MGPNKVATRAVPWLCTQNSVTRMKIVIGITYSLKRCVTSSSPSIDGQHRDRRRDHRLAGEQRRAADAEQKGDPGLTTERGLRQRHQRQNAALAAVVGAHHEEDVFDRDREDEREDQQRDRADDARFRQHVGLNLMGERLAQRVERAGSDIAVNDADRADDQAEQSALAMLLPGGVAMAMRMVSGGRRASLALPARMLIHQSFLWRSSDGRAGGWAGRNASTSFRGRTDTDPFQRDRRSFANGAAIYALFLNMRRPSFALRKRVARLAVGGRRAQPASREKT